ncbi:MAG TPA: ABC transporter permease [Chitinophagaceae bacterium]|nr:ABC transporter permease [Chitinophagaceae bacterium]
MIRNFFITAYRNLLKNKGYSLLNIIGLSAGLTCFAFIALWVKDEWSYDQFNKKADRIFRVSATIITQAETFQHACSPVPMAAAFRKDFPEVENTVRFDKSDAIVKRDDVQFTEEDILATDPAFFDVFSYDLLRGNTKTALTAPFSIILTESLAKKYFGREDPLGKNLTLFLYDTSGRGQLYTVTGLIADPPKNAHFSFNCLLSFSSLETYEPSSITADGWDNNSYYTYLLLKDKNDAAKIQPRLADFRKRNDPSAHHHEGNKTEHFLQPLGSIHLHSNLRYEIAPTGNVKNLYIFITVGLFILLIAAINYMNLATARSLGRAREVGVKKVLGASKKQLVGQHLTEAILVAAISFVLSLVLSVALKPVFTQLTGKDISILSSSSLLLFLALVTLAIGLIAGIYPAFFITAYKAAEVLKGSLKSKSGGVLLRRGLVVFQFAIAIVLIAGILVINSQLRYIRHKDLGFDKDALIALKVNGNSDVIAGYTAFKNDLLQSSSIKGAAVSNSLIVGTLGNSGARTVDGQGNKLQTGTYRLIIDPDYLGVYDMKMVTGRNFYQDDMNDTLSYIVNEAAVKKFGWTDNEDALNKPFEMAGRNGRVIGVVKNFHFQTLQHPIDPLVLVLKRRTFSQITLKTDMSDPQQTIATINSTWKKHFPGALLEYAFLDKKLQEQYLAEERFSRFFLYFSFLALLIACLGLLGLAAYATQQRVKEIGVRKVLGASMSNITAMLSRDFLKLVIIAILVATPLAWYIMNKWLEDFAYRVSIGWWVFAAAGIVALLIALFTVSFQAIKAAIANPVKSLRTE